MLNIKSCQQTIGQAICGSIFDFMPLDGRIVHKSQMWLPHSNIHTATMSESPVCSLLKWIEEQFSPHWFLYLSSAVTEKQKSPKKEN